MIYGHPSADVYKLSNQATFLDSLFSELNTLPVTEVSSPVIKKELEHVKSLNDILVKDEHILARYRIFDRSLYQHIYAITFVDDDNTTLAYKSLIQNLFNDVVPLVHKLKLHYQRPRPFQLAAIHKIELYPERSFSAQCPAFPSMHACMGAVLADVCVNTFPQTIRYFRDLGDDLSHSRVHMGVCLQSDVEAGKAVAAKVLEQKEFKMKYRL